MVRPPEINLPQMKKKMRGTVVEWDADRGFGFLRSGSARVFLHRREFSERRKDIELGDRVAFVMGMDAQGRRCASLVDHLGTGGVLKLRHLIILGGFLVFPGLALMRISVDWVSVGGYLAGINLLTLMLYAVDKKKAQNKEWRVPEAQLHLLEFLGGWPTAFLAQRHLRHKTSKISYQISFWFIVALYQLAAVFALGVIDWGQIRMALT